MKHPISLCITGASSGIGCALARAYAAPGVTLALTGRNAERLDACAEACRGQGAETHTASLDVEDQAGMRGWLEEADARTPIDLVIANAGISGGSGGGGESAEQARQIFAVNLDGVLNTVLPLVPRMRARRRGQIALMSSLAGFAGFPGAPAYSASKAAVRSYGEALRGSLRRHGIEVAVICPGFVDTPMTAYNDYPMPFLMSAERCAAIIKRGLARDRGRIAFPLPLYLALWMLGSLPPALSGALLRRLPAKT